MIVHHSGEFLGWDFPPITIVWNNAGLDVDFAGKEISANVTGMKSVTPLLTST